ncbi:hypothetical protein F4781DRAFT_426259 [Annulohypoxylon bovei var. microspora]|nr:hypothetical protein F4781DRAFT_426259 [Annulohypoxylon bovei var. microspora]
MSKATAEYIAARAADLKSKSTAAFDISISKNPDKVRAMLNIWLVPEFKPTFYDEQDRFPQGFSTVSGLDDVELLDPSYSSAVAEPGGQEGRYPVRMIDLETMNFVGYPIIGPQSQYCILSHSWKGNEVNYRYVGDAKFKAFNRALAADQVDKTSTSTIRPNDIDTIKHQCQLDIVEQEERIKTLTHESNVLSELGLRDTSNIVEELLSWRVDVQIVEKGCDGRGGLQSAKNKVATALAARDYETMEGEVFKQFLGDIGLDDDKIAKVINDDTGDGKQRQSEIDVAYAKKVLAREKERQLEEAKKILFFERHGHIREAVEELISCLQRSKSMVKIEKAIERSKEIFDKNAFQRTEKRYVWIDSCCINRGDDGEYSKSISAMGEWYKNAEFCLVHLDTNRNVPKDSLEDWQVLRSIISRPQPNITNYEGIVTNSPEWSTRAWTLQELVMSKTTFYVNSAWELLSRPVEFLGPWYYLCPFVSLYTTMDTNNPYLSILDGRGSISSLADALDKSGIQYHLQGLDPSNEDIVIAQKLIIILETLDLRIPRDIETDTARSRITQSVYVTVSSLVAPIQGKVSDAKRLFDNILEVLQPHLPISPVFSPTECARHAINITIKALVNLIGRPILDDRTYVANFGNVPRLDLWQRGLIRSHFSTQKVMSLVCGREATVMTDRAYCLMGMLGVRFPTFPAEGLTKALSRLLDEVIISSNDVSVFNWTGKQYGSPIRGRSLYPSSPEAFKFGKDEKRKKQKDQKLAELLQIERYEVMSDFLAISGMLVDTIMFVKDRQNKNIPLLWVKEILRVIKRAKFEQFKPHITNIGKILKYIETAFDSKSAAGPQATASPSTSGSGTLSSGVDDMTSKPNTPSSPPLTSLSSQIKTPSLPKDMASFKAPKFGRKKTEPEITTPKAPSQSLSSRGIGGFKPSLKGFGRKESGTSQSSTTPTEVGTPTTEPEAASLPPTPTTPSLTISDVPKHSLDEQVLNYIGSIQTTGEINKDTDKGENAVTTEPELPPGLAKVLAEIPAREFSKPHMKPEEIDTMISPNPIIVKNSGIEGLFDIQRVVVSMAQPEKLRKQIKNAISPHQKITGWCIISTGFARVMVSFSSPKHILEKELDIVQAVESKVLKAKSQGEESNGNVDTSGEGSAKDNPGGAKATNSVWQRTVTATFNAPDILKKDKDDDNGIEEPGFEKVKVEGARVSRMIKFVQEPDLTEVAGEWVLARFSGVPGAKWFLCYMELGGSGRDLYGHRIATDEIDFHNASPEMGLIRYWEYYMMQKKYRLCSILQKLMESKDWGNFKAEMGQNIVKRVAEETGVGGQGNGSDGDSDEEDGDGKISSTLKDLGGMALTMAGAGLIQQFYEWRAERLQKNLSADVLKKFPTHMQTAMESLDDNKDLMPSMFHSAKKIHMF